MLQPLLSLIKDQSDFDARLCLTGQHCESDRASAQAIKDDGFNADFIVDMSIGASPSESEICHAMGRCIAGIGEVLASFDPDLMIVLGDRYEILAAASAALVSRIPIVHLCGGDLTLGAFDDAIRHAVSKMASLHFPTSEGAARRLIQMGEDPDRITVSGSTGIDRIKAIPTFGRKEFERLLGFDPDTEFLLVSFHPETLAQNSNQHLEELISALEALPEVGLLLTGSNADPGASKIDMAFQDLAGRRQNAIYRTNLGSKLYFSALKHASALVGNSSSGLYEAPSFGVPTVNIGDRQKGREQASSVFNCKPQKAEILSTVNAARAWAQTGQRSEVSNPYGDGKAAEAILDRLRPIDDPKSLIRRELQERDV
ncbi:MAG: UDP-N-acetylglucosamine 2-epimerase (hydrolyzing) [Dinoroseobacter sp.]|nr:UDP-N-acetylglucosamine 2-epimerase (hydrolyzing) [Dinoroseobacter sp.]